MSGSAEIFNSTPALAIAIALALAVLELVKWQVGKKSNGHFNQNDRDAAADRCVRLETLEKGITDLTSAFEKYSSHGYGAMNRIEAMQKVVEETGRRQYDQGERIANMAASAQLSATQSMQQLTMLTEITRDSVKVLGEIRDIARDQAAREGRR